QREEGRHLLVQLARSHGDRRGEGAGADARRRDRQHRTADDKLRAASSRVAMPPSRLGRLARLGGMGARVAGSAISGKIVSAFQGKDARDESAARRNRSNAERVFETLSSLKGAAMKIGQTLALMGELPPEASSILRRLYDSAVPVPYEVVAKEI